MALGHALSMGNTDHALVASAMLNQWGLHAKHYFLFSGQVHAIWVMPGCVLSCKRKSADLIACQ